MRLQDYDQDSKTGAIGHMLFGVAVFIVVIILLVVLLNSANEKKKEDKKQSKFQVNETTTEESVQTEYADVTKEEQLAAATKDTDELISGNQFTSDDLDFWDMYPVDEETDSDENTEDADVKEKEKTQTTKENDVTDQDQANTDETDANTEQLDPSFGGKYTLIERSDGTKEWVLVNSYLSKHNYNFKNLKKNEDFLEYYEQDVKISKLGVDLSKYQGNVNFSKVKKAGIDFVMLRAGARGYGSGKIIEDSYFEENLREAAEAGLQIGIYFYSQAISKEEAEEEANYVLSKIGTYTITYPIVFDMEEVVGDSSRTEGLTKEKRTEIAAAFLNVIKTAGYTPMIYGTKEWLLEKYQLASLTSTDVWLAQYQDQPDYPYYFSMWQYTKSGTVSGITGEVDLNLCFIDYELK